MQGNRGLCVRELQVNGFFSHSGSTHFAGHYGKLSSLLTHQKTPTSENLSGVLPLCVDLCLPPKESTPVLHKEKWCCEYAALRTSHTELHFFDCTLSDKSSLKDATNLSFNAACRRPAALIIRHLCVGLRMDTSVVSSCLWRLLARDGVWPWKQCSLYKSIDPAGISTCHRFSGSVKDDVTNG